MLGTMLFMPGICFSRDRSIDSLVLFRIWNYAKNHKQVSNGVERNVYMSYTFKTNRRNPTLFLVPTMYSIAKGEKEFVGEAFYKMKFHDAFRYDLHRQVVCGTIPNNRTVMPNMLQFMTPNLYNETLYQDKMLSPFYYPNRFFYKYLVIPVSNNLFIVRFRPRTNNTQLVKGRAFVYLDTGRINSVFYEGEYDMISFKVNAYMDMDDENIVLPERCITESKFRFLGNNISASCRAFYNCPTSLPDSIDNVEDPELMATLRPTLLTQTESDIYLRKQQADSIQESQSNPSDTTRTKRKLADVFWDNIGYNMINSTHASSGPAALHLSPLFNPLYFSYSGSRGFAYKIDIGLQYSFNKHRYLTLNPRMGYNFKIKQFFYNAPLRMTYNPKRNGYAEITWANGNRTNHASLVEDIEEKEGEGFYVPEENRFP